MRDELMMWIAQAVAHSLWEGVAIGAVGWALVRMFRGRPGRQHAVLSVALLLMGFCLPVNLLVLAPDWQSLWPGATELTASDEFAPPGKRAVVVSTKVPMAGARPVESAVRGEDGADSEAGNSLVGIDWKRISPWVVGLYAAGLLAMLARLVLACDGSRRLRREARLVNEEDWREGFRRVLLRLEVKSEPLLMWSNEVAAPVLVGLFKPMILLPVALANRLSIAQAEAVLAHELAHLRRHDQWTLALQRVVETVLFFHPVVWWMSRELGRAREQVCDDMVVASGARPADYAETLVLCSELRLSGGGISERSAVQLAATGHQKSSLRARVMRILGQDDPIRPVRAGWWLAGLVALTLVVAGMALIPELKAQAPEDEANAGQAPDAALRSDPNSLPSDPLEHTVKTGETLTSIARQHNTSAAKLMALNPHLNLPASLVVGQSIVVAEKPGGGPILVELILAEVADEYMVTEDSMRREVLAKQGTIVSEPKLIVRSGQQGKVQSSRVAEIINPDTPQMIDYEMEVTPVLHGDSVAYKMKTTRAVGAGQGIKLLLTAELQRKESLGTWHSFVVGSMIGGAKLVGSVRFSEAEPGQRVDPPGVFFLLPDGKVRWEGKVYGLNELKGALPHKGGEVVIKAPPEMPYRSVVALMDVLKPVYEVRLEVSEQGGDPQLPANPARLAEIEAQLAECRAELNRLQAELKELSRTFQEHHPKMRQTQNRIEAARAYIKDLEATRSELKAQGAEGNRQGLPGDDILPQQSARKQTEQKELRAAAAELLRRESELDDLLSAGLGQAHPRAQKARERLEALGHLDLSEKAQREALEAASKAELLALEDKLGALLTSGRLGPKHPQVVAMRERIARLQDRRANLRAWENEHPADEHLRKDRPGSEEDSILKQSKTPAQEHGPAEDRVPNREVAPDDDHAPASESTPGIDQAPEPDAAPEEGGGSLPNARADSAWESEARTDAAERWYNALANLTTPLKVASGESQLGEMSRESYPRYLPGDPYPSAGAKMTTPFFAIGMNSRLQRKDAAGTAERGRLDSREDPIRTVRFLERGMPNLEKRFSAHPPKDLQFRHDMLQAIPTDPIPWLDQNRRQAEPLPDKHEK